MAEQVAQLERLARLKRFFSPQLAELIVAGGAEDPLESHRREVTVVFLDLRGFTAFAETAEPEEVMGVLREYHAEMGRLILAHEGTLERFTGDGHDGLLQRSGAGARTPRERAVRMALAMRDARRRSWPPAGASAATSSTSASASPRATRRSAPSASRGAGTTAPSARHQPRRAPLRRGQARSDPGLAAGAVRRGGDWSDAEPVGELTLQGFRQTVSGCGDQVSSRPRWGISARVGTLSNRQNGPVSIPT